MQLSAGLFLLMTIAALGACHAQRETPPVRDLACPNSLGDAAELHRRVEREFRTWVVQQGDVDPRLQAYLSEQAPAAAIVLHVDCKRDASNYLEAAIAFPNASASWYRWVVPLERDALQTEQAQLVRLVVD